MAQISSVLSWKTPVFAMAALAVVLSGCARNISQGTYSDKTVGEASRTFRGVIVSVRKVQVGPETLEENTLGAGMGALAGGVLGYQVGQGRGNVAATALGGLAGAAAGAYAQQQLKTQDAFEYVVRLENGEMRTVVQGTDVSFAPGQNVMLIIGERNRSRIVAGH